MELTGWPNSAFAHQLRSDLYIRAMKALEQEAKTALNGGVARSGGYL